jgi:predicted AAA+ superfamily ATPase
VSQETVNSYISLLEDSFIVFRLSGFNKNLRKEVSKKDKIYFWDLGLRNTIIDRLNSFDHHFDLGAMWENFIIVERLKFLSYSGKFANSYFWRTYTGAELDYIEEFNGDLFAFELKLKKPKKKPPKTWVDNYGNNYQCITKDNFWDFIS